MNILLLGGIAEARQLALDLHRAGHRITYSIAGLVRRPVLPCTIISGGFSQYSQQPDSGHADHAQWQDSTRGLMLYLHKHGIELLIDATHPYAHHISQNAARACQQTGLPCWHYIRPAWQSSEALPFDEVSDWSELKKQLPHYTHPAFTIGQQPLQDPCIQNHQRWLVRTAIATPNLHPHITLVTEIGPFSTAHEEQMLRLHGADLLVSKNSGGDTMTPKLSVACKLGIPIILLKRPSVVFTKNVYDKTADILQAVQSLFSN